MKEIENAKPGSKSYKLADGGGLCLLISPTGARLWRWRYRFDGTEKMMALGEYPLVTLKEARERHFAARQKLAGGIDPMVERKAEAETRQRENEERQRAAENSFEKIARKWWEWWTAGKSPRHADYVLRRLEADVFPAFGHKFIDNVTPADIRKLMLAIEDRGARDVAKRAHETTGQIFRYAIAHGIASRNPAADFKPKDILAEATEENFSRVDAKELPTLLAKMVDYDGDAITRLAMRLMAYTFVRTSELIESEWPEFDLDKARWDIPAERMKMDTPHIVPLSRQSVDVLRALTLLSGRGRFVFTAPAKDLKVANRELGTVESIGEDGPLQLKMDNGRAVELDPNRNLHLDYGYAVTSHSSQGQTADRVLIHVDTELAAKDLLNSRMAYVAISRGAHDAHIFTNDALALGTELSRDVSHAAAIQQEPVVSHQVDQQSALVHEIDFGVGMGIGM
jgi:integrase